MNTRRALLGAIGAALAAPRLAWAQQGRVAQVAVLFAGDAEDDEPAARPFFEEMRRLGWNEDGNIAYERFSGRGMREYVERLASMAAEREPDLIYATTTSVALAALKASAAVPVVFTTASDPVASGLVASLARPGRNATGAYHMPGDVVAKRLALVRELLPRQARIGYLLDRRSAEYERQKTAHLEAAQRLGLELSTAEFTNYEAVAKILAGFRRDGIAVVALGSSFTLLARRRDIGLLAARNSLALVAHRVEWAEAGALLTYGADVAESQRRGARIADRILRGAPPGSIAVERSDKFELVLNRKTARALGLAIPPALLKRADRVIE
jgi:putative ABC transport system substrate-binding protein